MGFFDKVKENYSKAQEKVKAEKQLVKDNEKRQEKMIDELCKSNYKEVAHNKLMFNDELEILGFNKGILLPKNALPYSEIVDYEIHQNGSSVSRGSINLARGAGMGLATGGLGLIVGLATGGKKKTKEVSEKIEIFIKTNDPNNPTYTLVTSAKKLKTDSKQYQQDYKDTQDIAAALDRIIRMNEERQAEQPQQDSSSDPLEEIAKLKQLLDMDAITQDEFDAKKKQLLNL